MIRFLLVCSFVLAACKHGPSEPPASGSNRLGSTAPGSGAGSASPDPWATGSAAAPVETPETRKQRADAAMGRVAEIEPKLAALRKLPFKQPVPAAYQSNGDFKAFVHGDVTRDLPPEKSRDVSAALAHIGLLTKPVDLATAIEQASVTQAGAYYDPRTKKFFLVLVPQSDAMLDMISAHELTHGLQDQAFDLLTYLPATLDDDSASARRAVVEGDATFTMFVYSAGAKALDPTVLKLLRSQFEKFASMDLSEFKDMTKSQSAEFEDMGGDIKAAIDGMDALPPAVLVPMMDSYMKGAVMITAAYEQGGWDAVNALFKKPPESTEQIMHPATKLYPKREPPRVVGLAKSIDSELTTNVMGEQLWQIYFQLWKPDLAKAAAEGWGGDRYRVIRRKDGRLIATFATIWDTEDDAKQFASAYIATLAARFPGAAAADPAKGVPRADAGKIFVKTVGAKVFIVDGADDAKPLDQLIKSTKFD